MADDDDLVAERGVLTTPDETWVLARERAQVISGLAGHDVVGHEAVAAVALGLSRRQVYTLLSRWRTGGGAVSDLPPGLSSGGRGRGPVASEVETVIGEVRYLTRQRRSVASVHRSIVRARRMRGLPAPSRGSVERRIAALDPRTVTVAREGPKAARSLRSAAPHTRKGRSPRPGSPRGTKTPTTGTLPTAPTGNEDSGQTGEAHVMERRVRC